MTVEYELDSLSLLSASIGFGDNFFFLELQPNAETSKLVKSNLTQP